MLFTLPLSRKWIRPSYTTCVCVVCCVVGDWEQATGGGRVFILGLLPPTLQCRTCVISIFCVEDVRWYTAKDESDLRPVTDCTSQGENLLRVAKVALIEWLVYIFEIPHFFERSGCRISDAAASYFVVFLGVNNLRFSFISCSEMIANLFNLLLFTNVSVHREFPADDTLTEIPRL